MPVRDHYHLRELPSVPYREKAVPEDFERFANVRLLPHIKLVPGGQRAYKVGAKAAVAVHILHNLVEAGAVSKCVADTRDTHRVGVRLRVGVWDAIVEAGFARCCLGSEESGKTARYYWTDKLLEMKRLWELRFIMDAPLHRNTDGGPPTNHALVCLRPARDAQPEDDTAPAPFMEHIAKVAQLGPDGKPDQRAIDNGIRYFREVEDLIDRINRTNIQHAWCADAVCPVSSRRYAFQPNPMLRQVHCGAFFRATRLYGFTQWSVQSLPAHVRQTITIDGEATAELDYSGMAPRMLYHMAGNDPQGDIYRPDEVFPTFYGFANTTNDRRATVRNFIKRATNICLNVASRSKANAAVGRLLADSPPDGFLHGLVYKTERTTPAGVVGRIADAHPTIRDRFFTEVGTELMTIDGKIMLRILTEFMNADRPAAGIHDAILCRASDVSFARRTMTGVYELFLRYPPQINQKF